MQILTGVSIFMFEVFLSALHSKTPSEIYSITWYTYEDLYQQFDFNISKKSMMYPFLLFHPHYFPHHYLNHHLLLMIQNLLVLRFWCQIQSIFPIHQIYEYLIIIIMYTTLFYYVKTISKIIMKTFCWYLLHFFTLSLEISDESDICTIKMFLGSQNW